jgi:hypothetical protein
MCPIFENKIRSPLVQLCIIMVKYLCLCTVKITSLWVRFVECLSGNLKYDYAIHKNRKF